MGKFDNEYNQRKQPHVVKRCFSCGAPGDIPMPIPIQSGKQPDGTWRGSTAPDPSGKMLCWECWDGMQLKIAKDKERERQANEERKQQQVSATTEADVEGPEQEH